MSAETEKTTGRVPAEDLRERISEAYAQQARESAREKLILDHLPMVRHIVQKVVAHLPRGMDDEDLISAGTLGLVRAASRVDPSKKAGFSTYAYICIRGAVIDELRRRSFVPSAVRGRIQAIRAAYQEHLAAHGRAPADEELAERASMSLGRLYRTLEAARNQQFLSIHGLTEDGPALLSFLPEADVPSPDQQVERKELVEKLTRAIQELPEKERRTILLYYERDLTMKEAAEVLEITESRVSQLHACALFKLSMKLRSTQ